MNVSVRSLPSAVQVYFVEITVICAGELTKPDGQRPVYYV